MLPLSQHCTHSQLSLLILISVLACSLSAAVAAPAYKKTEHKFPAFIKVCHRGDPELDACARRSLNALKEYLPTGVPELFIPPIEPLIIPEVRMDQDSGAIYMHSTYKQIHIYGISNYTLNDMHIDPAKLKFSLNLSFPNISLDSRYEIKGKIMMMPLNGEGNCRANFTDVDLNVVISGQRYEKHGRPYIRIKDIKIKYILGKTKLHLENLFNGDKALGERMNTFLNENWDSLSEEIRPLLENAMVGVLRSSTDKLFDKYSFDELLPE